ncbi:hypothetical protein [Flavobacterium sp.]|uniref:hypothetical protein n=1 Tax=Flavobacterium sp. TaxID=239 RepID=UPI00286AC7EC|nr:hypothetical protein [Flavobacterium sp.]
MIKNAAFRVDFKSVFVLTFILFSSLISAQGKDKSARNFWENVQFGGGIGLSVGSGYTDISLAPSAIYNFNQYFATGVGLQGSFIKVRSNDQYEGYKSYIYGGSVIGLFTPIEEIQLSAELEELRVNQEFVDVDYSRNFWNTALYVGLGYRTDNVTIGLRYNVLYNKNDFVYSEAFMPFIRVYF